MTSLLPDEITFSITPEDVSKSKQLEGTRHYYATCVIATAVNRWLAESSMEGQAWVNASGIEILANSGSTTYRHNKKSRNIMMAFDMGRPVRPQVITIQKENY